MSQPQSQDMHSVAVNNADRKSVPKLLRPDTVVSYIDFIQVWSKRPLSRETVRFLRSPGSRPLRPFPSR